MTPRNLYTYFFRESETLVMVSELVARRRRAHQPTAIWCAGCASGDEAYSVAIHAAELATPVEILGTDVDEGALAVARAGVYTRRALRYTSPERRQRWFAAEGDGYAVSRDLRASVSFRGHDLLRESAPAPAGPPGWDVVFCRNVFLYFDEAEVQLALGRLVPALKPDGLLILGAAERLPASVLLPDRSNLRLVPWAGGIAYQKAPVVELAAPPAPRRAPPVPAAPIAAPAARDPAASADEGDVRRLRARGDRLQQEGRLEEAVAAYQEAMGRDDVMPDLHLGLGACYLRMARPAPAHDALRRALFLEPGLWPAAFLLGVLFADSDAPQSRRYFLQARRILEREAPVAAIAVPEELAALIPTHRAALDAIGHRLSALRR